MPLHFIDKPNLPNNKFVAEKRLDHLKKRLLKYKKYYDDYNTFMSDIIRQGYAEKVALEEINGTESWYLPHHGIYHKKKKEKIRVVFDCGARYKDTSLNDQFLSGPDILNPMIGIICRFREDAIAIMCDIENMFYRFRVNLEHRNYLRFLWWKDGNLMKVAQQFTA